MKSGKARRWACVIGSGISVAALTACWLATQSEVGTSRLSLDLLWQTMLAGGWTGYVVAILIRQQGELEPADQTQ